MIEEAAREAQKYERCLDTVWTDGSKLSQGGVGGAVAWYKRIEPPEQPSPSPPFQQKGNSWLRRRSRQSIHLPGSTEIVPPGGARVEGEDVRNEPRTGGLRCGAHGHRLRPFPASREEE